jgi:hypothetical protein
MAQKAFFGLVMTTTVVLSTLLAYILFWVWMFRPVAVAILILGSYVTYLAYKRSK